MPHASRMLDGYPVNIMSLDEFFSENTQVALAFSGGCDSSYLLAECLARKVDVKPYSVSTAFQPSFEAADIKRISQELDIPVTMLKIDIMDNTDVCRNDSQRCYYCKHVIFSRIRQQMEYDGYQVLMDGTNASDDPLRRPGFKALRELEVVSPLRLAGMTKDDVRVASEKMGLSTAAKPSFSCLATHVPADKYIDEKSLDVAAKLVNETWNNTN